MTPKQELFVAQYLVDLNATQAAIRSGYSKRTAEKIGSENLRKPEIANAIAAAQQKRLGKLELTADRVLREVARLAFFDPRKLLNEDGTAKPVHQLDDDTAAAVAGLEVSEITAGENVIGTIKKYKIADKNSALDKAMRHLDLLKGAEDGAPVQVVTQIVLVGVAPK